MKPFDLEALRSLADDNYISIQKHPTAELYIYNYAAKAQYERFWNELTLQCRGLILDANGFPVARPFRKFFNLEEHVGALPNEPFEVYEKMDGSLGILYFLEGRPQIATRGSFKSDQAAKANEILTQKYPHIVFDPAITYLFEIIYPENRIVVDYGQREDLVLLTMIETATGRELPLTNIGLPLVERYDGVRDLAALRRIQVENKEGFVVKFANGFRVKLKFEEYVRLHRLITGVNAKHIWEYLKDGRPLDELLDRVPDEFYRWLRGTEADLWADYRSIEQQAQSDFKNLGDRKTNALYYQTCRYPAILFRMLDGRTYDDIIWKMIEPSGVGRKTISD